MGADVLAGLDGSVRTRPGPGRLLVTPTPRVDAIDTHGRAGHRGRLRPQRVPEQANSVVEPPGHLVLPSISWTFPVR